MMVDIRMSMPWLAQAEPPSRSFGGLDYASEVYRREFFSSELIVDSTWLMVAGSIVLLLLGALWVYRYIKMRHLRSAPLLVFHQVAGALGLNLTDQWLLRRVAVHRQLPTPLTLLMSMGTFEHHTAAFLDTQPMLTRAGYAGRIAAIRRRLEQATASADG